MPSQFQQINNVLNPGIIQSVIPDNFIDGIGIFGSVISTQPVATINNLSSEAIITQGFSPTSKPGADIDNPPVQTVSQSSGRTPCVSRANAIKIDLSQRQWGHEMRGNEGYAKDIRDESTTSIIESVFSVLQGVAGAFTGRQLDKKTEVLSPELLLDFDR